MPSVRPDPGFEIVSLTDRALIADLAKVHADSFSTGWSATALGTLLDSPGCGAFIAKNRVGVDGFVLYRQALDEMEIITLAVAPGSRRQGVARALCTHLITWALAAQCRYLFLEVAETNGAAIALYRQLGFAVAGKRPSYYPSDNGAHDKIGALCMRVAL